MAKKEVIEKREQYAYIDQNKLEGYWKVISKLKEADQTKIIECINMLHDNLEEKTDLSLRALAESKNAQRRMSEETTRIMKYANEGIVKELLGVIDNFERAFHFEGAESDGVNKFLDGFKMIYTSLVTLLANYEVKEIEALGLEFDPNLHQAVVTEKAEEKPSGTVLEVLQKGYIYKERVIRPAMVKVNE